MFRKELIVTVRRRDGRVETYRVAVDKNVGGSGGGDLVTLWAFRLMSCIFANVAYRTSYSISFTDLGGTSRSNVCIHGLGNWFFGTYCVERAPYVGFGSSTVAPSRGDYRLGSELARVRGIVSIDESNFVIRIVGSWTPVSDVSVCEVGLYMLVCDSGNVARYVLFDRSVFSPCVGVRANETIAVTYTFSF